MTEKTHSNGSAKVVVLISIALIAIIGVAVFFKMKPESPKMKHNPSEVGALGTIKNFLSAVSDYTDSLKESSSSLHYWANMQTDFGYFFGHAAEKNGYSFHYFSNGDTDETATAFLYIAFPSAIGGEAGRAFVADEIGNLLSLDPNEGKTLEVLAGKKGEKINWSGTWTQNIYTRLVNAGLWENAKVKANLNQQ